MSRLYSVRCADVTVANQAITLIQVLVPAGPTCVIRPVRITVGQGGIATPVTQIVQIHRKVSAFATVTSQTPQIVGQSNTQSSLCVGGTAATGVNASAEGAGTETVLWSATFNVAGPWDYIFTEREQEEYATGGAAATALSVKLPTAPGTLTHIVASLEWLET